MKYVLIVCGFLALACGVQSFRVNSLQKKVSKLEGEKNELNVDLMRCKNEMAKSSKSKERAEKTISDIKTIVKTVPSVCSCYNSPIDSSIIERVRGR